MSVKLGVIICCKRIINLSGIRLTQLIQWQTNKRNFQLFDKK